MSRLLMFAVAAGMILGITATAKDKQAAPAPAPAPVEVVAAPAPVDAAEQAQRAWTPVRVASRNLAVISLQAVPMVALLGAAGWAIRRRNVWFPRKEDGAMPFRGIDNQTSREALEAWHAAQLAEASQVLPVHTYAPHTTYAPHDTYRNHQSGQWAEPPAASALAAVQAPTWADLVGRGEIGPGRLYLGWIADQARALTGTWKSVYSSGVGGLQGSGKTWTAVMLVLQALLDGARVLVVDPHDGDPESLGSRLRPVAGLLGRAVASDPTAILRLLAEVRAELAARASGESSDRRLWLLVIDEYTALQRGELGEEIAAIVEAICQEGRKLRIICLLLGQRWSATRSGGGDLRNTLTSAFVHRMRPEDARMLTGMRAEQMPKDMLQLQPGECYVQTTSGDFTRVAMPRMSDADVVAFAASVADRVLSVTASEPLPNRFPTASAAVGATSGEARGSGLGDRFPTASETTSGHEVPGHGANDPRYEEVRSWILEGVQYPDIKVRLVGEHVTRGRALQEVNQRITAILQAIALEALYSHGDAQGETAP